MREEAVDGLAPDERVSRQTLRRIHAYARQVPTVYLPSHDPEACDRLLHRQSVRFSEIIDTPVQDMVDKHVINNR
jgi:N-acyl homoserine lactone hydrolase